MLDRRRQAKGYGVVPQDGEDLEMAAQEIGVVNDPEEDEADGEERITPGKGGVGDDGHDGQK